MNDSMRRLIILGPQNAFASLADAMNRLQIEAPVALITAGWEIDESDDTLVRNAIPHEVFNLELFKRSEQLFNDDVELIERLRDRQDELRFLRDAYRVRLDLALQACRHLLKLNSEVDFDLEPEVESAIEQVRQLDRQYFVRTSQICDQYEAELRTGERRHVVEHRREIAHLLSQASALVISGGHAAIILNRLRIFGILELAPNLPTVAWSGGAMALADQIVFFHDSPPQGAGNPEVLRAGMGLLPDFLPLPDARNRLNLDDGLRVQLFARRFEPFRCVELNEQSMLEHDGHGWIDLRHASQLNRQGSLTELVG